MVKETNKAPGATGAPPAGAAAAPDTAADATEVKRTRLSISKEKKLAYLALSLVSILQSKAVVVVLTDEQKAKVKAVKASADEVGGGDVLKPVTDRIAAIQVELKALDFTKPENINTVAAQAKELAGELDRQIKRKKQIEDMIAG